MSTNNRSDKVYEYYYNSTEKFDYFILGVAIAIIGYLGTNFNFTKINITNFFYSSSFYEILGILIFLISAITGFIRIETSLTLVRVGHKRLYSDEKAGTLIHHATQPQALSQPIINTSTGEIFSPTQALNEAEKCKKESSIISKLEDKLILKANICYHIRNVCLLLGIILIIIARILKAYI